MRKMNRILFVIVCNMVLVFSLKAQNEWGVPYQEDQKVVVYEEVVQQSGLTKDQLYARAIEWINSYFTAGASKITEKNQDEGLIRLKDRITLFRMEKKNKVVDVVIDYNIEIYVKDGRYKYVFRNFRSYQGSTSPGIEVWMDPNKCKKEDALERYANLNAEITKIIDNLKSYMQTGTQKKDNDW